MIGVYIKNNCVYYESQQESTINLCVPIKNIASMGIFKKDRGMERNLWFYMKNNNNTTNTGFITFPTFQTAREFMDSITTIISKED